MIKEHNEKKEEVAKKMTKIKLSPKHEKEAMDAPYYVNGVKKEHKKR